MRVMTWAPASRGGSARRLPSATMSLVRRMVKIFAPGTDKARRLERMQGAHQRTPPVRSPSQSTAENLETSPGQTQLLAREGGRRVPGGDVSAVRQDARRVVAVAAKARTVTSSAGFLPLTRPRWSGGMRHT